MHADTLTLALDGHVTLAQFACATQNLQKLVAALTVQLGRGADVEWEIAGLEFGSAMTTVRGEGRDREAIEAVVHGYEVVGEALRRASPIPYTPRVARAAVAIADLLNGGIPAILFETANMDVIIARGSEREQRAATSGAHGAVEGRVQTLASRAGLRFVLHEKLFDTLVSCYVAHDSEELLRDVWGRHVVVEGWVNRDAISGRPLSVRRITRIDIPPEVERGHYLRARAASPIGPAEPRAEAVIRLLRDA
jgi:hypothetical protein